MQPRELLHQDAEVEGVELVLVLLPDVRQGVHITGSLQPRCQRTWLELTLWLLWLLLLLLSLGARSSSSPISTCCVTRRVLW